MARDLRINIQGDSSSADRAFAQAAAALEKTQRELKQAESRTDALAVKARKLAEAEERAADKTRDLAAKAAAMRRQIEESGDATGELGKKLERLTRDTKTAALATDDYRRAADRAAAEAREQANAYDRVAENAREAARATAALAAASAAPGGHSEQNLAGQLDAALRNARSEATRLRAAGGPDAVHDLERQFAEIDRIGRLKKRIAKDDEEARKAGLGFLGSLRGIGSAFLTGGFGGASSALEGTLGTPVVGPALLATGAAAAVPAGAFLGGALGGGVTASLGISGAALGLVGAWQKDPGKFEAMWSTSIDKVKKRWLDSSDAFGNELTDALKTADSLLRNLPIEKILAISQSFVDPLATGIAQGIGGIASGFADALEKAQPVVDKLGPGIANLGHDLGDMFRIISEGSEGGADALSDLLGVIGYTVKAVGVLILGFENTYEKLRDFAIGVNTVATTMPGVGIAIMSVERQLFSIGSTSITTARQLEDAGKASHSTAFAWGEMGKAAAEAQIATTELNDAMTKQQQIALASADANIAVAQGWLDLKDELKDGAKTLNLNTQAGIDNEKQIVSMIGALERQRQQAIATGGGTQEAIDAANEAYNRQLDKLRQLAHDAGFSDAEVNGLIDSLNSVPKDTKASVQVSGLSSALGQGIALGNALNNIDGFVAHAKISFSAVNTWVLDAARSAGAHARGGVFPTSGPKVVGEHGMEMIWGSQGEYVSTAEQTRALLSTMGSASTSGTTTSIGLQVMPGADPYVGQLVQALIARGYIQAFAGGQRVTSRRG